MQLGLAFSGDEAGLGGETLSGNPYLCLRIGAQILHPVGRWVFGDQVETSVTIREPDLDFAGQTSLAPSSREIEVLLALEITVL